MTHDVKCYQLAVDFLRDKETDSNEVFLMHANALADRIQQTIEDYLEEHKLT